MPRLPSAYPSSRVAQLGNALGYRYAAPVGAGLSPGMALRCSRLHFRERRGDAGDIQSSAQPEAAVPHDLVQARRV